SLALLPLQLRDLAELELDRCLTSEDVHEHRELRTGDVDVGDRAVEVGERSGNDAYLLADIELEARAHLALLPGLFLADPEDRLHLFARQRRWARRVADERGDTRRV